MAKPPTRRAALCAARASSWSGRKLTTDQEDAPAPRHEIDRPTAGNPRRCYRNLAGDTIKGEFSFKSRFEDGPGANPE